MDSCDNGNYEIIAESIIEIASQIDFSFISTTSGRLN